VREWNIQGLPTDLFSTENGVIVTRGSRWPLMVDPQAQAIKWVKNMERKEGLTIFDLQTQGYLQQVCVFFLLAKVVVFSESIQPKNALIRQKFSPLSVE